MGNSKYTQSDHKHAIRLYKKGWGFRKISQVIGCSMSTAKAWIDAAIEDQSVDIERNDADPLRDVRSHVVDEYRNKENLKINDLARKNKVHPNTVRNWLNKAGLLQSQIIYDRHAMLEDLNSGMAGKDVADKYGCSVSLVYKVRGSVGGTYGRPMRYSRKAILEDVRSGMKKRGRGGQTWMYTKLGI